MLKHLKYASYVLRHKWFVFVECCRLGVPWRGLVHDLSKLRWGEWWPYVWSFNGPWKYGDRPQWLVDAFNRAWLHHQRRNPHHWQYWILLTDDEGERLLPMPESYAREMVADWRGAGRAQGHGISCRDWYEKNRDAIRLHDRTRALVESLIGP